MDPLDRRIRLQAGARPAFDPVMRDFLDNIAAELRERLRPGSLLQALCLDEVPWLWRLDFATRGLALVACLLLGLASAARAQDADRRAADLVDAGLRHADLAEWDAAIAAFKQAYGMTSEPDLLYLIGDAHRGQEVGVHLACRLGGLVAELVLYGLDAADVGQ